MTPEISCRSLIKSDYKFQDGGQNGGRVNAWLCLKRLYFISIGGIAYCISPYASFYAGLTVIVVPHREVNNLRRLVKELSAREKQLIKHIEEVSEKEKPLLSQTQTGDAAKREQQLPRQMDRANNREKLPLLQISETADKEKQLLTRINFAA